MVNLRLKIINRYLFIRPRLEEQVSASGILETGIKIIDLLSPFPKAAKLVFWRRRGWENRAAYGIHLQDSEGLFRDIHILRCWRKDEGRSRALERDGTTGYHRQRNTCIWPDVRIPRIRFRAPLTAITLAEFFRDELGSDILFLMDNVYRAGA